MIRAANDHATEQFLTGAVEILAGMAVIGTGIALGPDVDPNAQWVERNGHLVLLVPGAAVSSLGVATVVSGLSAERLSSDAAGALEGNDEDRLLYYQCVKARDDWSGNHVESTRLQIALMKEAIGVSQTAQDTSNRAQAQSLGATSVALDARTNALRATQVATASAEATKDLASMTEKMLAPPPPIPTPSPKSATSAAGAPKSVAAPKGDPVPAPPRSPPREVKPAADGKASAPRQAEFPSPVPPTIDRKPSAPVEEPRRAPPASPDGPAPSAKGDTKVAPDAANRVPSSPILNQQH